MDWQVRQMEALADGMRELADMEHLSVEDVVMGLLLAVECLALNSEPDVNRAACHLHHNAQEAWLKSQHGREEREGDPRA